MNIKCILFQMHLQFKYTVLQYQLFFICLSLEE